MSKKHFNAVAATIKAQVTVVLAEANVKVRMAKLSVLNDTVAMLCNDFAGFNANFDRQRFFQACGL